MGALAHVTDSKGNVHVPPEKYHHQSLSGKIPPHFDINNLSVAPKLKKKEERRKEVDL